MNKVGVPIQNNAYASCSGKRTNEAKEPGTWKNLHSVLINLLNCKFQGVASGMAGSR